MSESVERFTHTYEDGIWNMDQRSDGKWVRYADHERIVKELEARIRRIMTTREQAERFIRHHLHSAEWHGEQLIVAFEQESLIAALLNDVEAPSPSLSNCIAAVEQMQQTWDAWAREEGDPTWVEHKKAAAQILTRLRSLSPSGTGEAELQYRHDQTPCCGGNTDDIRYSFITANMRCGKCKTVYAPARAATDAAGEGK